MKPITCFVVAALAAALVACSGEENTNRLFPASDAPRQSNSARLGDEVMRHVVDECDLYRTYQKNRIGFDPIEVGASILPEMRRGRTDWGFLRDSIRDTVQYEESFLPAGLDVQRLLPVVHSANRGG